MIGFGGEKKRVYACFRVVVEPGGCVWNSDQWIDYMNADQMY